MRRRTASLAGALLLLLLAAVPASRGGTVQTTPRAPIEASLPAGEAPASSVLAYDNESAQRASAPAPSFRQPAAALGIEMPRLPVQTAAHPAERAREVPIPTGFSAGMAMLILFCIASLTRRAWKAARRPATR